MAETIENEPLATVYLDSTAIGADWLIKAGTQLRASGLIARYQLGVRNDPDNGVAARLTMHTRQSHVPALRTLFRFFGQVQDYPLQCAPDYAEQVREHTKT